MSRISAGGATAGGGADDDDGDDDQTTRSGGDSTVRSVTERARARQRDSASSGRTRQQGSGGPRPSAPDGEASVTEDMRPSPDSGAAAPSVSQEPAALDRSVPGSERTGVARPSKQTETAAAEQAALRSKAAAETGLDESEVRSVDPSSGRVRVTSAGRERLAAEQFQEQRSQARDEALRTRAGAGGGGDIPLGDFETDELQFEAADGTVRVSPAENAAERILRERAASQSDRFDENDIAIVRVGQGERLEARVTQSAATREARQQLAEREGVDADDVVVRQPEPGRFVAEEREGPPVEVDVSTDVGALFDRAAGDGDAGAPLDVDANVDRDSRTGQIAAAGLAGVAAPEPTSSLTGGLVAGGAVATAVTLDALRRSDEVGIGEGVQRSELDVGSGGTVSELEVGAGAGATTTEVEVTEPAVQEVEPTDPADVTEVEIGGGSESAGGQASGDTVVPGEYPLPGRDFPANPREDVVQRRNEPSDVLDTSAVIDQGTGAGDLPSPGETPEIGEPTIGEETGAGTGAERSFPTGSEAVVSEEITRAEAASESEVTSGEETLDVNERAADAEVAGSAPGSAARSPPAAAETDDSVSTSTDIFSESLAGSAAVGSSLSTDIAADTATSTALEDQAVGTGAEAVTENVFKTDTATETVTETGTATVPGFGLPTQGGPSPSQPTEGGGSTGLPFPTVPGGNAGGAGGAFEARDDEIFPSGILTGAEAFELFFGDSDDS